MQYQCVVLWVYEEKFWKKKGQKHISLKRAKKLGLSRTNHFFKVPLNLTYLLTKLKLSPLL